MGQKLVDHDEDLVSPAALFMYHSRCHPHLFPGLINDCAHGTSLGDLLSMTLKKQALRKHAGSDDGRSPIQHTLRGHDDEVTSLPEAQMSTAVGHLHH